MTDTLVAPTKPIKPQGRPPIQENDPKKYREYMTKWRLWKAEMRNYNNWKHEQPKPKKGRPRNPVDPNAVIEPKKNGRPRKYPVGMPRPRRKHKLRGDAGITPLGTTAPTYKETDDGEIVPILLSESPEFVGKPDEYVLQQIETRFKILNKCAMGITINAMRSLIVSGAGGVGKTHTICKMLDYAKKQKHIEYERLSGMITPINLYKILYKNRAQNMITLLDDSDSVFKNSSSLNILKAALDSSIIRTITWASESKYLCDEMGQPIPKDFVYEGTIIFITNLDFQRTIDFGRGELATHMQALMTRATYIDLKLQGIRELMLWVDNIVREEGILRELGLTGVQETQVLEFMQEHRDRLRTLSIRTALKIGAFVLMEKLPDHEDWRVMAEHTELR